MQIRLIMGCYFRPCWEHLHTNFFNGVLLCISNKDIIFRGFPGGGVVKNPSANAGDTGSSPGPGRSHMPWSD